MCTPPNGTNFFFTTGLEHKDLFRVNQYHILVNIYHDLSSNNRKVTVKTPEISHYKHIKRKGILRK